MPNVLLGGPSGLLGGVKADQRSGQASHREVLQDDRLTGGELLMPAVLVGLAGGCFAAVYFLGHLFGFMTW